MGFLNELAVSFPLYVLSQLNSSLKSEARTEEQAWMGGWGADIGLPGNRSKKVNILKAFKTCYQRKYMSLGSDAWVQIPAPAFANCMI